MAIINDGHSTRVSFAGAPTSGLLIAEKEVTPPGYDAGGENDVTTMLNNVYRTKNPKSLITLTDCSFVAAYEASAYTTLLAQVGVNQAITVTFPDGATLVFQGWLNTFTPNANVEGAQPTANVVIMPSNHIAGVETAPVLTP